MVKLTVNGKAHTYDGDPDMPLLWYVRDDLRLTGTPSTVLSNASFFGIRSPFTKLCSIVPMSFTMPVFVFEGAQSPS